jgi:uncharacterized Zn finger protein (UPF0148 family)
MRSRADQWLGEVCPHCGARAVFYEDGHWVCRKCGTVIEDHPLTHTVAGTSEGKEEPPRGSRSDLIRLKKWFQEAHRDALEWMGKPEANPPRGSGGTPIGPGYAKALARALTTSGIIQDTRRAELFALIIARALEYKHKAFGVEVPSIDRVVKAIRCMLYGVPNTKDCEQPTSVVDATKKAINATQYYGDLIRYIAKEKFGKEPSDELVKKADQYLYALNDWIMRQGLGRGITNYPAMPIVAATALAIAVIETGDPRSAIKALSKGGTRAIITRLRLNEFINQLANRETKS